jgi:phosphatidylserine/phosphatidylglycerophosphate/cardiolipin synthase-like enzyme
MPVLYLFVVTPVPERGQMVPRTYDTLATFGVHEGMSGQNELINEWNEKKPKKVRSGFGTVAQAPSKLPNVVEHANSIDKPDELKLEAEYGMKVCVAMLNTCAFESGRWRYREIYIHSKLMIANDAFFTLGSANANQRSFAVDSEINVAVQDRIQATRLRKRVWPLLSGSKVDGGDGKHTALKIAFQEWHILMQRNLDKRNSTGESVEEKKLQGFILPLEDKRTSYFRMG